MSDIRFSEIDWASTFFLALVRLGSARIVIFVVMTILEPGAFNIGELFMLPVILGVCVLFALVFGYLYKSTGVEWLGLGTLPGFLTVAGDPLLWLLTKFKPEALPVDRFGFVNRAVIFVSKA